MRLSNRTAVVTGSRRGIGRAIALALAQEGANVVVSDLSLEDCQAVIEEIQRLGGAGLAVKCDVTSRPEVENMVAKTVSRFGGVDILVNNAAMTTLQPFLRLRDADWDNVINVTLKGQFICSQVAARQMARRGWGRIINIASISSGGFAVASPLLAAYTAAKGGVIGLTKAMAVELTPLGINVNAICPGTIDSGSVPESIKKSSLPRIPKGRLGKPEEVASLAVFLASPDSEYITGTAVVIDGGWLSS